MSCNFVILLLASGSSVQAESSDDVSCLAIRQALSAKQSLAALQELLAEAAAKGAEETPLADGLRKRIASAEDWERRADAFFASPNKHALQALEVRLTPRAPGLFHF